MPSLIAWFVMGGVVVSSIAGCGEPGIVAVHRVKGSETSSAEAVSVADAGADAAPAAGPCPPGWNCMDIAALGLTATDEEGNAVTASCSMGAPITCDDADPAASCEGLPEPFCAHLKIGAQDIVSCAQRCSP